MILLIILGDSFKRMVDPEPVNLEVNTLQCKSGSSLVPLFLLTGNFLGIL